MGMLSDFVGLLLETSRDHGLSKEAQMSLIDLAKEPATDEQCLALGLALAERQR